MPIQCKSAIVSVHLTADKFCVFLKPYLPPVSTNSLHLLKETLYIAEILDRYILFDDAS